MFRSSFFRLPEPLIPLYRIAIMLLIFSGLRLLFYAFNAELFTHVTADSQPKILYGGVRFDLSALAYINILYIALYQLLFLLKYRKSWQIALDAIFFIFNGLAIALNCIDIIYYRFILKRTTFNVIDILENEQNIAQLAIQCIVDYWYIALLFLAFLVLLIFVVKAVEIKPLPIKNSKVYILISIAIFCIYTGLSIAAMRGGFRHSTRPITLSNAAAYTVSPEESAIVLNTPFCIFKTIGKRSFEDVKYFAEDELENIYTPVHQPDTTTLKPYNVVIFILESFSREFVGSMNQELENGNYRGYTPFLDSLANVGLSFSNAYANGRKSIDAMPSILASIPSLTMPYIVSEHSTNRVNSIASLLGGVGYTTAFFHGAPNGSMGFDGFAKTAGFERYYGRNEYGNNDDYDGIWGIWDHAFFQYFANELNEMPEPFCCALFSLSSHHPFKVPEKYKDTFPKGPQPLDECIGYTDNSLRLFFDAVRDKSWYGNTLFVLTADHSILPEHDEYRNNAQAFAVPIIFFAPNDSILRGNDENFAQQTDIMPTILSYLGYSKPFVAFGIDLLDDSEQRFVVNNLDGTYQVMMNDTIAYFADGEIKEVFDMKNDPNLMTNVYEKGRAAQLEKRIKAYIQQYNGRMRRNNLTTE